MLTKIGQLRIGLRVSLEGKILDKNMENVTILLDDGTTFAVPYDHTDHRIIHERPLCEQMRMAFLMEKAKTMGFEAFRNYIFDEWGIRLMKMMFEDAPMGSRVIWDGKYCSKQNFTTLYSEHGEQINPVANATVWVVES
jgi:hypothetical protein